jgi:SAM-dependent methyltransferase
MSLFSQVAGEASFARRWLDEDLRLLPPRAPILEVGGGTFILAYVLAREGFPVTAIEPTGDGFGAFERLGTIVLELATRDGAPLSVVRSNVEDFESEPRFEFAYSVNVMEHVAAPDLAIRRVSSSMLTGRSYRFLCPNYLFPYEPHFNLPTLGSKALTEKLLRSRIVNSTRARDPIGLWKSLNWITVPQVRRIAAREPALIVTFRRDTLARMIERSIDDAEFTKRRAPWMVSAANLLKKTGLLRMASLVPATIQPLMDARVTRLS